MKNLFIVLALISSNCLAGPNDVLFSQRNSTDTGTLTRIPTHPNTTGVIIFDSYTVQPKYATLGMGITVDSGVLNITGVTGPIGPQGDTGATGPQGPAGTPAATPSQASASHSLNSSFQISSSRPAFVFYSVQITSTASIGSDQDGDAILEVASDSDFTTNVQTISIAQNGQVVTLAAALNSVETQTFVLSGFVPAAYYVRIRTVNNSGTPTYLYRSGQEILM